MKIHELKILPEYFEKVKDGSKLFEVRFNDREFKEGDLVILNEMCSGIYTGRKITKVIGYVLEDESYVKPGYVVFSLLDA